MRKERTVKVRIGGKLYIIVSDDDYLLYTIVSDDDNLKHIEGDFEPLIVSLFQCLVNDGDIVLDVGANIGCTAILFGDLAQEVHAFEPSPTTFEFLQKNIQRSGHKNIVAHKFGLGAEPGEFTLTFSPANRSGGFVADQTKPSAGHVYETIAIRQMDEVVNALNLPNVDFIKIDVEGFEGSVLRGGQQTLSAYRPVAVMELNHWCLNALQRTSVPDFLDHLRSIFPILHAVDGNNYLDLYDEGESYKVMYHHILHARFPNIVAAFEKSQLDNFYRDYEHQFVP